LRLSSALVGHVLLDHLDRSQEIERDGLDGDSISIPVHRGEGTTSLHVEAKSIDGVGKQAIVDVVSASDLLGGQITIEGSDFGLLIDQSSYGLGKMDSSFQKAISGNVLDDDHGGGGGLVVLGSGGN
jgi:hypothetical protein